MIHPDGGLSDTVIFTWDTPGLQTIILTVMNAAGDVHDTYTFTSVAIPPDPRAKTIYLPLTVKGD